MRRFHLLGLLVAIVLLLGLGGTASAQTYLFSVERAEATITINSDGTATVEYLYQFVNDPSADPMEYVDIGMPTSNYYLSSVSAEIDGQRISDITYSPYISNGVALGLGSKAIPPGERGLLHVTIVEIGQMLYTTRIEGQNYASFNFMPNYFDSTLVKGSTDMTVTLYLPVGLEPEQPRWFTPRGWPGSDEPLSGYDEQGRVFYRWNSTAANAGADYRFGAAFPVDLVPAGTVKKPSIWESLGINQDDFFGGAFFCCCSILFIGFPIWGAINARKRRLQYMPPKISVEGHGIKRGLTAVEAAIMMERPLDKVMTMILFGILKKGAARVTTREPLALEITDPLPEGLYAYETDFLAAFQKTDKVERQKALSEMVVSLIKSLTEKMKGFSRKETLEYYQSIMKTAWEQVEAANTPEVKSERYEQALEWTMLDKDYDDRTRDIFRTGPVFYPTWWWRFDPGHASAAGGGSIPAAIPGSRSAVPGADFAASVVNGIQNFSSNVVRDLSSFTSGVTNRTNPVPVSSSSSSGRSRSGGGGGGRSCACACACAGCACACAGGGR
ncbi:MAG TPA: hypothetical protein PKG95_00415 [Anaerolineaceae bacterium]|nr:hypothetical protein [Anaerolineaceae bacterium]